MRPKKTQCKQDYVNNQKLTREAFVAIFKFSDEQMLSNSAFKCFKTLLRN